MADLTNVIRWNAGFIRGLAQSVLERARTVRSGLVPYPAAPQAAKDAHSAAGRAEKTAAKKKKRSRGAGAPRRRHV
jgi:hypothetical protein